MSTPAESIDDLPLEDLRRVVARLVGEVGRLQGQVEELQGEMRAVVVAKDAEIADLKDEIARLKGLPPRPKFKGKPSGMEQATSKALGKKGGKRGRGSKVDKLTVTSQVKLKVEAPPGSRFRGYEDVLVQDLRISVEVVRYRRERWETPDGERIVAALPAGIRGGFGAELRRLIAAAHFQGQVTSERLTALLNGMGLVISKRQVVRLLSQGLEALIAEDQAVLLTGLETARWITVDDTSARHAGQEAIVTQLGDNRFTVFRTGWTKSRRAFLSMLQAGREDYVVDDEALAYMARLHLAAPLNAMLAAHPAKRFASEAAWLTHLQALGLDQLKIMPNPVKVATEAALWAAVREQGLLADTVIVSDGAGQFAVADHALCWVHTERLIYKLQPTNAAHRKAVELTRALIWWFYRDLKAYKRAPDPKRARMLRARFDRIFTKKTGYILLDRQLARLHRHKHELLRVLERPEIPLHTNGSENDIRCVVTKRKISGGTVSEAGKTARDVMLGLAKTCAKLNVSFYRFLGDRFGVLGAPTVPSLPGLVRLAAA
jgi:Transposase IS66 family